jgi:hypothetical protein
MGDRIRFSAQFEAVVGIAGVLQLRGEFITGTGAEISLDAIAVTYAYLDVAAFVESSRREDGRTFKEYSADRIERRFVGLPQGGMEVFKDGAVKPPQQKIDSATAGMVLGHGKAIGADVLREAMIRRLDQVDRARFEKVQASAQIDDRSDDGGMPDPRSSCSGALFQLLGIVQGACRTAFPEVRAMTEPIIGIPAGLEPNASGEDGFGDLCIASMEAQDEMRQ